jgi:hypothetical protein
MRIQLDDPAARDALAAELAAAGCETRALGAALEIVHLEVPRDPFELSFFLRAWSARNPQTQLFVLA